HTCLRPPGTAPHFPPAAPDTMMPTSSPALIGAAPTRSVLLPAPPSRAPLGGRLEPSAPPCAWPPRPPLLGQGPLPRPEPRCPGRAPVPATGVPHGDGRAGTRTSTTHLPGARPPPCVL